MKKFAPAVLAIGTLSLLVAGCETNENQQAAASTVASTPLVEALDQNPDTLTPGLGTLAADDEPESYMNSSLVYLDTKDKFQPELATRWTVSKNGLKYTFYLNPKAKWSNGQALTSADVVYSWKYYTNKQIHITTDTGWNYVKSVTASGPHTVVFTLSKSYAPFMSTVALSYIVPKSVFSKWTPDQINHGYYNTHEVGSGPYMLKSWTADQQLELVPNPYWYGPKVHIQDIIFRIIPDDTTQFNELRDGNLTMGSIPPEDLTQLGSLKSNYNIVTPLQATYNQITPIEQGFLKDVKVRQALDYATPRQQIVQAILHNQGVVAADDQVPGGYWNDPNVKPRPYDLTKAAALLKADGFKKGAGGWLYKDGKEFTVPIWTGSTSSTNILIAQAVSASWEKIGVNAPVKTADYSFIFGANGPQFDGKMEALLFSWGQGVFPDDTIDFNSKYIITSATSAGENAERYSNPEMDKLTEEGTSLVTDAARRQVYWKIQQLEHDTVPIIFLYWAKSDFAYSKHLHGFTDTVFGHTPVWDWSLQ
ncbi:ABC transporter substrate-binding protein [Alicyclobacillus acidiphilus]|uniref:ABC transporter substrate-binding protein n=1 Tax=Alicyclobacillus acidiphilus TaxID=182455 RepID=UPI000836F363|nr:peptide ABC transporter substrate-binding protein [Alicyclobacillus acidiphilus]